ncbi:MAG: VIT and VWA domain-containing protein, partial [Verrucomicrobiae bacterium]|nr:VIT and VWA domain-containing protein [Verrucomicrobiae bacterium]
MKRKFIVLFIEVIMISSILNGLGVGFVVVHDPEFWKKPPVIPPPRPVPPPRPIVEALLEISLVQVKTEIMDQHAITRIEQEFYNPNPARLEGTFILPVPRGASVGKFSMEIDGKNVDAELLDSKKAREVYEDIVRRLKDPALLEYTETGLLKARIFPIEPHSKKRISVSFSQLLKSDSGLIHYSLPLSAATLIKNLSVKIDLKSTLPIKSLYSPVHNVEIKRDGDRRATIGFESSNLKPDADFQLFYSQQEGEFGLRLLSYKESNEDGFFLMLATLSAEIKQDRILPKDVVFVVDSSGSMAGEKIEQAKKALKFCVENLEDKDRFEIVRFSTETESLFGGLVGVDTANKKKADKFITSIRPTGGTAINEALLETLKMRPEDSERLFVIVFLTDGLPTVGVTDEKEIIKNVLSNNKFGTRIFCFGIGTDVNTHLLDQITAETRSVSQYILPEEDIEVKVSSFFTKIREPVLANLNIIFPEEIKVSRVYPKPLPDLFKGNQLVVVGRYSKAGKGKITISATSAGENKTISYDANFVENSIDHDFVPRLWATRRIGFLMDEIRLRGENRELRDEVVELAKKYNILTPYTAYLIMEDESARNLPPHRRVVSMNSYEVRALRREFNRYYMDM